MMDVLRKSLLHFPYVSKVLLNCTVVSVIESLMPTTIFLILRNRSCLIDGFQFGRIRRRFIHIEFIIIYTWNAITKQNNASFIVLNRKWKTKKPF